MTRLAALFILIASLAAMPATIQAQTTNHPSKHSTESKPSDEKQDPKTSKKQGAGPFHGNLLAVDKIAKTISVGKRMFQVTSETKIKKNDKPATLDDGVIGEEVGGYYKTGADGKLNATSIRFGPKPNSATPEKKKGAEKAISG
jgi:hypothetical protein